MVGIMQKKYIVRLSADTKQRGVDWQFTVGDARHKLKSIYPKIKE